MRWIAAVALLAVVGSFSSPLPAQTTRPTRGPASQPNPGASGLVVTIKSAKVDYLNLKKPLPGGNFEDLVSNEKLLAIVLEITNKGEKEITYNSFNGAGGKDDHASLMDTKKKLAALVNFGDLQPAEITKQATLKPGDTVTDIVVFAPPQGDAKPATLFLPAKNHGDAGLWKLEVKLDEPANP